LMLLVMGFFGWRGYQNAVTDTERLAMERSVENNDFAAQLAAQQVSREIADLFEIADDEANRRPVFREKFDAVRRHELLPKLADPDADPAQIEQWRSEFFVDPQREDLDDYLKRRIDKHQRHPRLASIFVLDPEGTQVAAAFAEGDRSRSIGRNVAFRTYFHGKPVDLDQRTRVSDKVKPISEPHLSAVFQSTTTGMWKVAVSTRIIDDSKDREELIGLFVITVNLSDLEFLQLVQHDTHHRFAALVDGRPGDHMGLILQHPLFDEITKSGQPLPDSFRSRRVPIDEDGKLEHKRYTDPLGDDELGKAYRGLWIASTVPVSFLGDDKPTGLVVLVQENYSEVTGPVRHLGTRLLREGMLAIVVVLLVTALLWYAVLRLIREPRSIPRPRPMLPDETPLAGEPTLVAPEKIAS
jgi:hypothetical protein